MKVTALGNLRGSLCLHHLGATQPTARFRAGSSCAISSAVTLMTREHLPNSPLIQVSCEIRFHGELALYDAWGRFQREVRPEFPKLFVPPAVHGVPPLTQPVKLGSASGAESILLAINSFAFSTERYQDFPSFRGKFLRLQEVFCRHTDLLHLTRFGLRYINVLPPASDGGNPASRVHPCLTLELTGLERLPGSWTSQPQIVVEKKAERCTLRASLLSAPAPLPLPDAEGVVGLSAGVNLDLDCYVNAPGSVKDVGAFLDEAHTVIDAAFFGMITEEYHRYLRGSDEG